MARPLNQCDVKIKITEYQPGATREEISTHLSQQPRSEGISAEEGDVAAAVMNRLKKAAEVQLER